MSIPLAWVLLYLAAVNLLALILTVSDKRRARRQKRRISEATLMWTAAAGGALVMLLTMRRIRHKTKHRKFMWGLPLLLLAQAVLLGGLIRQGVVVL